MQIMLLDLIHTASKIYGNEIVKHVYDNAMNFDLYFKFTDNIKPTIKYNRRNVEFEQTLSEN